MPIYAPSLPPRPVLSSGQPPAWVLLRFDLMRLLRNRIGRFFGFAFLMVLILQVGNLYLRHLVDTKAGMQSMKEFADAVLSRGAELQAGLLHPGMLFMLWFLMAILGGGLVARDTLHRVRPLMYAHPLSHTDYLSAKLGLGTLIPFVIQLPFILLPWVLSLLVAGIHGPVWATAPLRLLPAALIIALLMGAVSLGASSLAATPRAGVGWVLGIVIGTSGLGSILGGILHRTDWMAISPIALADAWPKLLCAPYLVRRASFSFDRSNTLPSSPRIRS